MANLYLVTRPDMWSYDEFNAFLVNCETEEEARNTHPISRCKRQNNKWVDTEWNNCTNHTWPVSPDEAKVTLIGEASPDIPQGVLLSSFNAG